MQKVTYKKQTKQGMLKNEDNLCTNTKTTPEADYFVAGPNIGTDRATSAKTTIKIHNEFSDVFTGIGCFKDTSLKVKKMQSHTKCQH